MTNSIMQLTELKQTNVIMHRASILKDTQEAFVHAIVTVIFAEFLFDANQIYYPNH